MDPKMQELLDRMASAAYTVGESAVKGAKFAGKKAGALWDAGKVRVKIIELRSKEADLYEKLGRKVYGISKGEAENKEELDAILSDISAVIEERNSYRNSGAVTLCPVCGTEVSDSAQFCSRCGAALKQEEKAEESTEENHD